MILVMAVIAVALVAVLVRAPAWLSTALLLIAVVLTIGTLALGGVDRAGTPLILLAMALGLLVPSGVQAARSARIAPPKGKAAKARKQAEAARAKPSGASSFDAADIPGYELLEKVG